MDFGDSGYGDGDEVESLFDFDTSTTTLATSKTKAKKNWRKKTFGNISRSQNSACSDSASSNASASASDSIGSTLRTKRSVATDLDNSLSFSLSTNKIRVTASRKRTNSSRRRLRRQDEDEGEEKCDDGDELSSTRSSASTCTTDTASGSIVGTITTRRVSVRRGMGSSAYAVQDAGTYQMIHDECSYLCSTILSRRIHPSKAIDAAIDLVTLLSNRKNRSILWQGGNSDGTTDSDERKESGRNEDSLLSPSKRSRKMSPIPKIWFSIFEVLAMATTTSGTVNSVPSSSNSSFVSCGSTRTSLLSTQNRTKSARRKEKELSGTGGIAVNIAVTGSGCLPFINELPTQKLTPEMKDLLACILYFVSWDCTMSGEHSVAAMGAVKSSSMARKIRLSILERGTVLSGILRLMEPSQTPIDIVTISSRVSQRPNGVEGAISSASSYSFPSKILPTCSNSPDSSLRHSPARKRSLESSINNSPPSIFVESESIGHFKASSTNLVGDPTALGRRNRKKRRKLKVESTALTHPPPPSLIIKMESILEQVSGLEEENTCVDIDDANDKKCYTNNDRKKMPPPTKRSAIQKQRTGRTKSARRKVHESDEFSFADKSSVHKHPNKKNVASASQSLDGVDDGSSIVSESTVETSVLMSRVSQKIDTLRSKVLIESNSGTNNGAGENLQKAFYLEGRCQLRQGIFPDGDSPWLSMVCLESLTRILTGKEKEGQPSCLEGEDDSGTRSGDMKDDMDVGEDENNNIFMVTNRLIGKSGIIPLLASTMSQTMIVFAENYPKLKNISNSYRSVDDTSTENRVDEEYWNYFHNRLNLLASLIDEACFFSEHNRRSFCEDDPFSFEDRKEGLIFHILVFLRECSQCDLSQLDHKGSEVMSLALRTLTSLTHDNPLAAEQLKISNACNAGICETGEATILIRGIDILAKLVFKLEESVPLYPTKSIGTRLLSSKRSTDHDMHRYDSTLFCLTTFANIIEGAGICRMLMETNVALQSGSTISWLKWLCQWIVKQTDSFREEILAIGNTKTCNNDTKDGRLNSANERNRNCNGTNNEDKELLRHEEEKLVAAGNGCVVLACLMTEPDDDDPESSVSIQNLIKDQMPLNKDKSSSGLTLIVNTLKAYCNYYHISMGQVSFAIVAPVKKLIEELENVIKFEGSQAVEHVGKSCSSECNRGMTERIRT